MEELQFVFTPKKHANLKCTNKTLWKISCMCIFCQNRIVEQWIFFLNNTLSQSYFATETKKSRAIMCSLTSIEQEMTRRDNKLALISWAKFRFADNYKNRSPTICRTVSCIDFSWNLWNIFWIQRILMAKNQFQK